MADVIKKATREGYGEALAELGAKNPNVIVMDADLAAATKTGVFKKAFPERFIDAGADILTFHVEACEDTAKTLKAIKARGCLAAVSVKPNTPVEDIYEYLDLCDMVLVMTVEPGYGGQALIPECLEKVKRLRREITARGIDIMIQVDGGINTKNAPDAIAAGADVLVAGSAVFSASNKAEAIRALRG